MAAALFTPKLGRRQRPLLGQTLQLLERQSYQMVIALLNRNKFQSFQVLPLRIDQTAMCHQPVQHQLLQRLADLVVLQSHFLFQHQLLPVLLLLLAQG
jgi:hypothetical protein